MINESQIMVKWKEFKDGVRNIWGGVSDDELERTKGNFNKISALIQAKHGETRGSIKKQMDRLLASFDNETDKHPNDIGSSSYQRSPLPKEVFDHDRNADH